MADTRKKKLPIGLESFCDIRTQGFYYVDKTNFIKELLYNWGKVNLFTRPRRFGKSLNMNMLRRFFEIGCRKEIFEGLKICEETELCEEYMGKFPVVSISLKGINGYSYEMAFEMAAMALNEEARRHQYLLGNPTFTPEDRDTFSRLLKPDMTEATFCGGLRNLSELLQKYYDSKVIILIDEYDVPLAKAFDNGYYDRMVQLIRNMFEQTLKTNESLQFAVLTGCLRISKESIFTGLNNPKILTIADVRFDEYFGFTDEEVKELLQYYELSDAYGRIKEWYDGYRFGNVEVYCPWDVINYCDLLRADPEAQPQDYWSNSSGNEIVKQFIQRVGAGTTKHEIEKLVAGETVTKEIRQELTYKELYNSIDNIWSVLFTTGYLTQRGKPRGDEFDLVIPNMEIRKIFTRQIMELFKENVQKDGEALEAFCGALKVGDADGATEKLTEYLKKTISIRDTFGRKALRENFYHGILLGILGYKGMWDVFSNRETGDGYGDILVEIEDEEIGIIIEVKYADDGNLEDGCKKALAQIERRHYEEQLREDGMTTILKYGVACFKKRGRIELAK